MHNDHMTAARPWFRLGRHDGEGAGGDGGAAGGAGDGTQGGGTQGGGDAGAGGADKTFTQADLDRIVSDRLTRERTKFADYDELKTQAEQWAAHQAEQLSELDRERQARAAAEAERDNLKTSSIDTLRKAAIIAEAAKAGVVDANDVFALLPDKGQLEVGADGTVAGVAEAVAALLESKPHLKGTAPVKKPAGDIDQGTRNGGDGADLRTADKATLATELGKLGLRTRS